MVAAGEGQPSRTKFAVDPPGVSPGETLIWALCVLYCALRTVQTSRLVQTVFVAASTSIGSSSMYLEVPPEF